ncbi:MAG: hypothetical protein ABIW76_08475 [Fibrobacteria bacterium]
MITNTLAFSALIWIISTNSIQFKKINPDSIIFIQPSDEGYTSRSTNAILVGLKNGDSTTVLYNKDGNLKPGTLRVSSNKAWFTIANPSFFYKKGNCEELLCSLKNGACKCDEVVSDSGFIFSSLPDSAQGGCVLVSKDQYSFIATPRKNKKRKKYLTKRLSEEEMTKRFLSDFNKTPRID